MTKYINTNPQSLLAGVEFTPMPEGNFTFFHAQTTEKAEILKAWLTSKDVGQEIVAETQVGGKPMLVTHGDKSFDDLMKLLAAKGEKLKAFKTEEKFNAWKWRGRFSNIGQSLNLISGYRKEGKIKGPKIMFAALNFAASGVNAAFGGQKSEDEYQLLHLKKNINQLLGKHVSDRSRIPDINDDRSELREEPAKTGGVSDRLYDVMKANSVRIGEIGLRYMGSIALAFPMEKWKSAAGLISKGAFKEAFQTARNKDSTNFWTGVTYLTGKTIGLFSKVPDPYNPAPHTAVDTVREKVLFRLSSTIETGAAGVLAVGNLKPNKEGKRDYIGAAGGATLMAGLTTRWFAKFGRKVVDMDELFAHTTDVLAQTPPDKLPQLIAESASYIKDHFENKTMDYSKIYIKLMTDLYKYHHIALDNFDTEPEDRIAKPARSPLSNAISQPKNAEKRYTCENPSRGVHSDFIAAANLHAENGHVR